MRNLAHGASRVPARQAHFGEVGLCVSNDLHPGILCFWCIQVVQLHTDQCDAQLTHLGLAGTHGHPLQIQEHVPDVRPHSVLGQQRWVLLAGETRRHLLLRAPDREGLRIGAYCSADKGCGHVRDEAGDKDLSNHLLILSTGPQRIDPHLEMQSHGLHLLIAWSSQELGIFLALALVPLDDDSRGTRNWIDVRNLQLLTVEGVEVEEGDGLVRHRPLGAANQAHEELEYAHLLLHRVQVEPVPDHRRPLLPHVLRHGVALRLRLVWRDPQDLLDDDHPASAVQHRRLDNSSWLRFDGHWMTDRVLRRPHRLVHKAGMLHHLADP
mmetsp:Transcript_2840/g.6430  ORF Transcript_2840/g.6430 Transcript_2840/m.6430 type:complete len:324 (+) Transcript_2840:1404-2375(+)